MDEELHRSRSNQRSAKCILYCVITCSASRVRKALVALRDPASRRDCDRGQHDRIIAGGRYVEASTPVFLNGGPDSTRRRRNPERSGAGVTVTSSLYSVGTSNRPVARA